MEHIDGALEEPKQGLPISSISSTIQDEEEEDEEDADKSSSAVGSASQKPLSDRQMTSVGNGITDVTGRYVVQSSQKLL